MTSLSKSIRNLRLTAAALLLPMMAASCQWMGEDYEDEIAEMAARYINITVSVSTGNTVTRAYPNGGEYGDGVEKGLERENKVNDITLIFYELPDGATLDNPGDATVACVEKYGVYETTRNHDHSHTGAPTGYNDNEVLYTTGDQRLDRTTLEVGKTYHVLVVANADPLVVSGERISSVREKVLSLAFTGTGIGVDATNFVMTSSADETVTLTEPTVNADENKYVYNFQCLHIERLAARIDFWAKTKNPKTSQYGAAIYDATTYDHAGYVYNVGTGEAQDHFVLTSITPFNLNSGNEYLLKRVTTGFDTDAVTTYLGDETTTNYVLDPYTADKNGTSHPANLMSTLTDVQILFANTCNVSIAGQQNSKLNIENSDNIIIGYTKENTLCPGASPLYYYATGLAFEGYYYKSGQTIGDPRKFYYYIRHQGEKDTSYNALTADQLNTTDICPFSPAMNFGIVRNNIYRISIESITPDEDENPKITIRIKVKKWDKFVHTPIYM